AEAEAFAGNGVDSAGGVADKRDVAAEDAGVNPGTSDGAAFGCGDARIREARGKLRKLCEGLIHAEVGVGGQKKYADFLCGERGEIKLAGLAPVNFDEVAPRGDFVVATEGEAAIAHGAGLESGPAANAGCGAVGSDDPMGAERGFCEGDCAVGCDCRNR